jgi:hypothetical protein
MQLAVIVNAAVDGTVIGSHARLLTIQLVPKAVTATERIGGGKELDRRQTGSTRQHSARYQYRGVAIASTASTRSREAPVANDIVAKAHYKMICLWNTNVLYSTNDKN